jgi:hypothetical protein
MCACFQIIRIIPANLRASFQNDFLKYTTQLVLNLHEIQLLVCGNVYKDGLVGFHHSEVLSNQEANEWLMRCINEVDKTECTSVWLWKDMPNNYNLLHIPKTEKLKQDISMVLEIDPTWQSLKDYQTTLSKKYLARSKKIIASASEVLVKEMDEKDILSQSHHLHNLYLQVIHKQPFCFGALKEGYFVSQKQKWGDSFSVKGLYLADKLVAFYTTFSHPEQLDIHYVGINYEYNSSHSLYFYIHFLALQEAIQQKKKRLNMGRTSLEAKAILGCAPIYNNSYLTFRNYIAECVYSYFDKNLSEPENWITRHPFKTSPSLDLVLA